MLRGQFFVRNLLCNDLRAKPQLKTTCPCGRFLIAMAGGIFDRGEAPSKEMLQKRKEGRREEEGGRRKKKGRRRAKGVKSEVEGIFH